MLENTSISFGSKAVHMLSTYCIQNGGHTVGSERALSSTFSITWFVTVIDTGDPMTVPKVRYVADRQNLSRTVTWSEDSDVWSCNVSSLSRRLAAILQAKSTGRFVERETASHKIGACSPYNDCSDMNVANSIEFLTWEELLLTGGANNLRNQMFREFIRCWV